MSHELYKEDKNVLLWEQAHTYLILFIYSYKPLTSSNTYKQKYVMKYSQKRK